MSGLSKRTVRDYGIEDSGCSASGARASGPPASASRLTPPSSDAPTAWSRPHADVGDGITGAKHRCARQLAPNPTLQVGPIGRSTARRRASRTSGAALARTRVSCAEPTDGRAAATYAASLTSMIPAMSFTKAAHLRSSAAGGRNPRRRSPADDRRRARDATCARSSAPDRANLPLLEHARPRRLPLCACRSPRSSGARRRPYCGCRTPSGRERRGGGASVSRPQHTYAKRRATAPSRRRGPTSRTRLPETGRRPTPSA